MKTKQESKIKRVLGVKKAVKSGECTLKKAVKNVEEILKKKTEKNEVKEKKSVTKPKEQNLIKIKGLKTSKKIRKSGPKGNKFKNTERGVVYIGHIPHGFYEEQMQKYFSQFGKVTRVRVCRSKKTGRSKGYGFVEFLHPEVAKIAAESMNNYLMFNRIVKTGYIPPEKQHRGYFKGFTKWTVKNYPRQRKRLQVIKKTNRSVPNKDHEGFMKKSVKKLTKLSEKLKAEGIDLDMKLGDVKI